MRFTKDQYGLLGQQQPDDRIEGGDSACWMGHYVYLGGDTKFPYVKTFEKGFGAYVRHPQYSATFNGFGAYYKNPWDGVMSRDQLTGVIGALIRQKERMALLRLILHHACWLFLFTYNTRKNGSDPKTTKWKWPDFTFMDFWATYLRGFGMLSWLFWPLLVILDVHTLINTVLTNYSKDPDQINYALKLMVSREFVPTPTSWLSAKILNKDNLHKLIWQYWSGWRQQEGMDSLFDKKMAELGIK